MLTEVYLLVLVLLFDGKGADAVCCNYIHWECCHRRGPCNLGPSYDVCGKWRECQFMGDGTLYWVFGGPCEIPFPPVVKYPEHVTRLRAECCADSLEGCNFFCCNCYGCDYHSCRKSRNNLFNAISKKAPVYENPAQKIMKAVDSNKDGVIDLSEAADYHKVEVKSREVPVWFKEMDTNGDGYIQPLELDRDYNYGSAQPERSDIRVHVNVQ